MRVPLRDRGRRSLLGRRTVLAGAAAVALAASVATVVTVATIPASDVAELDYLNVVYWPVGMLAWGVLVAAAVELVLAGVRRAVRAEAGALVVRESLSVAAAGVVAAIGASAALTGWVAAQVPGQFTVMGGPASTAATAPSIAAVERVAPKGPFELEVADDFTSQVANAAYLGVAYGLMTRGVPVRLPAVIARGVADSAIGSTRLPRVLVTIPPGGGVAATVLPPPDAGPARPPPG